LAEPLWGGQLDQRVFAWAQGQHQQALTSLDSPWEWQYCLICFPA